MSCPCCAKPSSSLLRGQWVEIRPLNEILATLDAEGKLDGVPFMPEMARHCGQRLRVFRRADKTCVEGHGVRLLGGAVFLEGLRCDGSLHGDCQRGCLMFWREAWLKPVEGQTAAADSWGEPKDKAAVEATAVDVAAIIPPQREDRFYCQSTELAAATTDFPPLNVRHYLEDLVRGELTFARMVRVLSRVFWNRLRRLIGLPPAGEIAGQQVRPPKGDLGLVVGQWVEVRSAREILETLDTGGKNRGLTFEIEMLDHCGRRYQVAYPVQRIILEQTGRMVELTNTVVLEGVACEGTCAKNCPRSNYFYWRECWLVPVDGPK